MTTENRETIAAWRARVTTAIILQGRISAQQIVNDFGRPPASAKVADALQPSVRAKLIACQGHGVGRVYEKIDPSAEPPMIIGRGGMRVASVFHLAQGIAA